MSEPEKKTDEARREERTRLLMLCIFGGVIIGLTLVVFVLAIFDVPLKPDNYTNSYSTSPGGHSALVELLRNNKRQVRTTSGTLTAPEENGDQTETLVLLEPRRRFVDDFNEEFVGLFQSARAEHTSIILSYPKREYREADEQPGDGGIVLYEGLVSTDDVESIHDDSRFTQWFNIKRRKGPLDIRWYDDSVSVTIDDPVQVFTVPDRWATELEVLAETADGEPVVVRWLEDEWRDRGGVTLVSDPDFLTNRYIARPGAGEFAMKIFELTPRNGAIVIDEDLHGFSSDASLEYLAATPPGLWVTLSVFALLVIFGWRQATVLRPRDAEPQDRRARKYAIEGLARMMERAGDHHKAGHRVLERSRFVLGKGVAQVQGAGMTGGVVKKGKTGKITRIYGNTSEERLVAAAQKVSHLKRTGETEHGDWE